MSRIRMLPMRMAHLPEAFELPRVERESNTLARD
jgi:hypothetical protein